MAKLCKSKKVVNSSVEPRKWFYGLEHCRTWEYASLPSGESVAILNLIQEDYTELNGYIHLTNGGSDPAPVGLTKLATVDVTASLDVDALVADIKAQLDASIYADLIQSQVEAGGKIEILNNFIGLISEETGNTDGATVAIGQQSFGTALGLLTEDGASASFELEFLDTLTDTAGNVPVESFLISINATISMSLLDTSKAKFEELFIKPLGGSYENGAEKIIGFGTGTFFKSLVDGKMGRLVGHLSSAPFSDRSEDWEMLALLQPTETNFNKELRTLAIQATSYYDATAPEEINIFRIGNRQAIDLASL